MIVKLQIKLSRNEIRLSYEKSSNTTYSEHYFKHSSSSIDSANQPLADFFINSRLWFLANAEHQ